jgi:nucleotide-binding universal stress UspA family protein
VQVAIDLVRMLELPLGVVRVDLPRHFGPPDTEVEDLEASLMRRCELYRIPVDKLRLEGNPIAKVVEQARRGDLLVVGRRRSSRDSFSQPDVALRIARLAPCSTLVVTL